MPLVEKVDNPTGLKVVDAEQRGSGDQRFGYHQELAPGQLATWVRAARCSTVADTMITHWRWSIGNYAAYFGLINKSSSSRRWQVRLEGAITPASAMYAPPDLNRFSQYDELRLYGIGLRPSRPGDMPSLVVSEVFSDYLVDVLQRRDSRMHGSRRSPQRRRRPFARHQGRHWPWIQTIRLRWFTCCRRKRSSIWANVIMFWQSAASLSSLACCDSDSEPQGRTDGQTVPPLCRARQRYGPGAARSRPDGNAID